MGEFICFLIGPGFVCVGGCGGGCGVGECDRRVELFHWTPINNLELILWRKPQFEVYLRFSVVYFWFLSMAAQNVSRTKISCSKKKGDKLGMPFLTCKTDKSWFK